MYMFKQSYFIKPNKKIKPNEVTTGFLQYSLFVACKESADAGGMKDKRCTIQRSVIKPNQQEASLCGPRCAGLLKTQVRGRKCISVFEHIRGVDTMIDYIII